jgi:hypothetical protein
MAEAIRIEPGHWRPEDAYEQIAWVHLPWADAGYVMLDFPEAVFCDQGLLFLSHTSPCFQQVYADIPQMPWEACDDGIRFERRLPNALVYGGSLRAATGRRQVDMTLWARNEDEIPISRFMLQVCVYLPKAPQFAANTMANKFVHVDGRGWMTYVEAEAAGVKTGTWRLGWRGGLPSCDAPLMVTRSADGSRLMAVEWGDATYSLTGNPAHPCMHADPVWPDLLPGESTEITGRLTFFDGGLDEFYEQWKTGEL